MSDHTKVSIIIPCYNKGKYVKAAVESAVNQTYTNIEIVCVDDASTDNSREILKELSYKYKKLILLEENENIGVCRARNKAILFSSGEYILPLDADDTIERTYVEKAITFLNKHPNIDMVYSRVKNLNTKKELFSPPAERNLLYGNYITCSSVFRKSDFQKVGGYDPAFDKIGCEDWDLYISFLEHGLSFHQLDEILFNYRQNLTENRTAIQLRNKNEIYYQILLKHKDLYKKYGLVELFDSLALRGRNKILWKKYKKYKTLFIISLVLVIVVILISIFITTFINTFNLAS